MPQQLSNLVVSEEAINSGLAMYRYLFFKTVFLFLVLTALGQGHGKEGWREVSCAEKWWALKHPFVAKKALRISLEARRMTEEVKREKVLSGIGNGDQVDAFRHIFWMATLSKEIGVRRTKKLGIAHEKGNKRSYKRGRLEDNFVPDKISSDMDLYNNDVGLMLGLDDAISNIKNAVVLAVLEGRGKMIKTNASGDFLDKDGNILSNETLKGTWKNKKCLVPSNYKR